MNKYKHSGAFGDLLYSMATVKHTGGGEFYLHLNQIDWIGQFYYGSPPADFHKGRLTAQDFEFMKTFMEAQDYISKFSILDNSIEITHNLDRFRPLFVGHPANYLEIYASVFNITGSAKTQYLTSPWLTVPNPKRSQGRPNVINRTTRWIPHDLPEQWSAWREQGWEDTSVFVGLEAEYEAFTRQTKWMLPWQRTSTMLELAEYIAGADTFIGNQSQCYALAVGLGVPAIHLETRRDLPRDRNECVFPERTSITYF